MTEETGTVDWALAVADQMRAAVSSREAAFEQCRRYGYQLWNRSGNGASQKNTVYVPQQDSFPAQCAWRAAMYLHANTVGVGQLFYRYDVDDALRKELGAESLDLMRVKGLTLSVSRELSDTNFWTTYYSALNDLTVLGTAVMYSEFNKQTRRLEYSSYQVGENGCWIFTNSRGRADQFARKFKLTAKQAFERWGESVHERVKEQLRSENSGNEETEYLWLVYPRATYGQETQRPTADRPVVAADKKAWGSLIADAENKHVVEVGGYDAFPFAVCRWGVFGNGIYGWGPIEMSLPDIKYLAKLKYQLGEAVEKTVNPPMIIPYSWEGFDRSAGAFNFVESTGAVRDAYGIVDPPPQLPDIRDQQQRAMMTIRANFLLDAFETFDEMTKTMSATEVRARGGQSVRAIAPIALNVHNDLLSPLLQRSLDLLLENGVLGEGLPESVSRERVRVKYVSVLSAMILEAETNKIGDFFGRILEVQQTRAAFGPLFDAYFNIDAVFAHYSDFFALPEDIVRSKSEREAKEKELRAQAQAAQEQEEQSAMLSKMNPQQKSAPGSYAARRGF